MHYFSSTDSNDAYDIITSENFLRGTLVRAFANGLFLMVGWGLVALYAKKKLQFLNPVGKKKRRSVKIIDEQVLPYFNEALMNMKYYDILEKF